jgi:hypothetical protein
VNNLYITEFHYEDGDVGAYDDIDVQNLWAQFTKTHPASHIIIRPATPRGEELSGLLHNAAKMAAALNAVVATINATGGVARTGSGTIAPMADAEWTDMGDAYVAACAALGREPLIEGDSKEAGSDN